MTVMEAQVAIIPNRWPGHRVDVCMVIRDSVIRFVARDVLEAIGVTPDGEIGKAPGHRSGGSLADHAHFICWTRLEVGQVLNDTATIGDPTAGYQPFLRWLDDWIRDVEQRGIERVVTQSTRQTPNVTMITDAAPPAPIWYSVEDTARILSTDPALHFTRTTLFQVLDQRGWIHRRYDTWLPTPDFLLNGWLLVRDVRIPADTLLYPQICITPLGVTKLHYFLGGTAPLELTTGATA